MSLAATSAATSATRTSNGTYGEYAQRGDYHRELDTTWRYYPVYVEKMRFVRRYLDRVSSTEKIIDLGCGEGLLAEEYGRRGYDIIGLDANYESPHVLRGDMTKMHFADGSFDHVLALDVIEHLSFEDQEKAIREIYRVLAPGGRALLSIPNLAHFASRVSFALAGRLIRTSTIDRHPGDRPIQEHLKLCRATGFQLKQRTGLFPSLPLLSMLTYVAPGRIVWLHRLYNILFRVVPGICFLNILELKKEHELTILKFPGQTDQKTSRRPDLDAA